MRASAVPLRKTTPGRRAEDSNAHLNSDLEFSVRVGTDFTVQANIFVLGRGPFHGMCSFIPMGLLQRSNTNTKKIERNAEQIIAARREPARPASQLRRKWPQTLRVAHREDGLLRDRWNELRDFYADPRSFAFLAGNIHLKVASV